MNVYVPFSDQKKTDATLTLKAMGIQLGINIGISLLVLAGFSFLRPRHTLVYAPKYKFSKPEQRPPTVGTGWFSWIKPVLKADDDFLMDRIGYDAVMFLRFIRLIRRLLIVMSIIGICALVPVNIVATYYTGDWPPPAGLDLLSISGINYNSSNDEFVPDTRWYWSPAVATWIFSILIAWFMYRASCDYIEMRQRFFRHPPNALSARSLLVSNVPKDSRSDDKLKSWMDSMRLPYPVKQAIIGLHSNKLTSLTEEHEAAVRHLEDALSSYLNDGKSMGKKKRPTMRVDGFLFCGGKKVDAIDYYTDQVKELEAEIRKRRKNSTSKISNYGWVSFDRIEHAHTVNQAFNKQVDKKQQREFGVRLSSPPKDLIWANLPMDAKTRRTRRWIGRLVYWILIFVWMIPVGALSATSNVVNLIRLFPNSEAFIDNNTMLMGIIQSWFTPIVMALFFILLPHLFRFLSKQQGYQTHTTLDRKVLVKLYVFFIINNLLVFTLASILIGIFGQIRSLILSGTLDQQETSIGDYVSQLAKNISDVSTFWINYVCIKALGLTMEMAQLVPLFIITLRKWITRPSPRELRDVAQPPEFDYPLCYNMMLFFFTIALLYSAIAPLVLPFALLFFAMSTVVYKYMLMYIFVTKTESGGRIWPVLFQSIMTSTLLFQILMIIVLRLKDGFAQCYALIPLPVLTVAFQYFYYRRMQTLGSFLNGTDSSSGIILPPSELMSVKKEDHEDDDYEKKSKKKKTSTVAAVNKEDDLSKQFQDPGLHKKLMTPMVHEDVKHLLPQVYHRAENTMHDGIEMMRHRMDLNQQYGFEQQNHQQQQGTGRESRRLTVLEMDDGSPIKFCTVAENEALEQGADTTDTEESDDESTPLNRSTDAVGNRGFFDDDDDDYDKHSRQGLMESNHMDMAWRSSNNNHNMNADERRSSFNSYNTSLSSEASSKDVRQSTAVLVTNILATTSSSNKSNDIEEPGAISRQTQACSISNSSDSYDDDDDMDSMIVQTVISRRNSAPEHRNSLFWLTATTEQQLLRRHASMPELLRSEPKRQKKTKKDIEKEPVAPEVRRNSAPWHTLSQQHEEELQDNTQQEVPQLRRNKTMPISRHRRPLIDELEDPNIEEEEEEGGSNGNEDHGMVSPPSRPTSRVIFSPSQQQRLSRSTSVQGSTGGRRSWYWTAEGPPTEDDDNNSLSSRPPSSLLVRSRTVPGRQSATPSITNSRYRITYYDDLLNDIPSLPEFGTQDRNSFASSFERYYNTRRPSSSRTVSNDNNETSTNEHYHSSNNNH
ncbi:hypothetical protein BDB00DRAFT_795028 [Zychaea mexicana]|uniref:uncharacterized protein n=1 Tax=Zychaea mexicana TaxID=64656 RepID=UPI0022FDBEC9|nr:uncharacterized protein BDB00DRAFT_795028 [Zychaea mexicana]KAI9499662.1 hypothetical protein BDB00DRAFT_795028 [Zychaea mexicana]